MRPFRCLIPTHELQHFSRRAREALRSLEGVSVVGGPSCVQCTVVTSNFLGFRVCNILRRPFRNDQIKQGTIDKEGTCADIGYSRVGENEIKWSVLRPAFSLVPSPPRVRYRRPLRIKPESKSPSILPILVNHCSVHVFEPSSAVDTTSSEAQSTVPHPSCLINSSHVAQPLYSSTLESTYSKSSGLNTPENEARVGAASPSHRSPTRVSHPSRVRENVLLRRAYYGQVLRPWCDGRDAPEWPIQSHSDRH